MFIFFDYKFSIGIKGKGYDDDIKNNFY